MHQHELLLQRRSALGCASAGGPVASSPRCCAAASHGGLVALRSAWRSPLGATSPLLGLTMPQCPIRATLSSRPVRDKAPRLAAAVSRHSQRHQHDTKPQTRAPSLEVQELLKRLVRANSAAVVIKELSEWRGTAPERQQRDWTAVVGPAALQVLTRVLGPGAKLHPRQWEEVQVLVQSLVSELCDLSDTLTLEQLSAVAASLVVLLPLLGEHGREVGPEQDATDQNREDQDGHEAPAQQLQFICSPEQVHDLAAALPGLANDAVSKHSLPAVLAPVCQVYGSMLQLLQLTHTDPHAQPPGTLTLEGAKAAIALYGFLSRTVLCAPDLARQLGHVGMEDLQAAVQAAVQYRLALPAGVLEVPSSFWDAVRQRVDELVGTAREAAAALDGSAAAATEGQGSGVADLLNARSLAEVVGAMSRDLAARRLAEQTPGSGGRKAKGPGGAEAAWLAETTAVLLRSHLPGEQDGRSELVAGVASAQRQLAEAERDLEEADRDRQARFQQQQQQQQQQAAKRKKAKAAAKQAEEQQGGEEGAGGKELADAEELYAYFALEVKKARASVEDRKSKLLALGVVGLREQLDTDALLQLAREVAAAAEAAAASGWAAMGVGSSLGAALEGLVRKRLGELQPVQLVQALVTVAATRHTLTHKAVKAVLEALTPHLGELSHTQQLDMLSALSGPGEHASEPTAAGFLAALCNAALAGRGGLGSAPTDLLFAVVDTSARWRLLLDQGWLGDLEQELMSRLAEEGGDGAGAGQGPPAAANGVGPLRRQLLSGVILPVVRRGQSFSRPDLFVCALEEWRDRASKPFPGLDTDTAALLLEWAARGHGWQHTARLHKVVEALAVAALRLQFKTSENLACVLLLASRAVAATVPLEQHGVPSTMPGFLVPAATHLLTMKPTVNDLASAVAALYGKPRPSPDHALLKRMLDMAQPQMAGARPLSYAHLLSGCVAAGWRPYDRWLAEHHAVATKALRAPGAADADTLLQLLRALSSPQLAPQAGSDRAYMTARNDLLSEVAERLLQKPARASLAANPDELVGAVRQVVVQGARPDGQWVQRVTDLVLELLPRLSFQGLANTVEGLALLGAAPPASFLDAVLTQAGKYDMASYDSGQLGLLLGGVHRLKAGALSAEAQEVLDRAHAAFLSQCLHALPAYTPAQAVMVAGSVVAFQLAQPAGGSQAVVDARWLASLVGALQQRLTSGVLPPPALLVDLLRLGSRVLSGGKKGGTAATKPADRSYSSSSSSSSKDEGGAKSTLIDYVQQSLSQLAAAGTDNVDWPQLLRAALAAGVLPDGEVLQKYVTSLAEQLYGTVRLISASKDQLNGAVSILEEAITSALMPSLPWVPASGLLPRVLEAPALLQACSPRQLALLCTYAAHSGLGSQLLWERVGAEVRARGEVQSATRCGGSGSAAADYFAVCYALEVAGYGVAGTGQGAQMHTWLEGQLRALDDGGRDGPSMLPLQALHVLWVAHRLGDLSLVPPGVWAAVHAATDGELLLLLPYQLAQLVELRAAAAAAGLQLPPAPDSYTERVLEALLRPESRPDSDSGAQLQGVAAARAVAYLPAGELGGVWKKLVPRAKALLDKGGAAGSVSGGGGVTRLSAADWQAWVLSVERLRSTLGGFSACALSPGQLAGVARALVAPEARAADGAGRGASAAAEQRRLAATLQVLQALFALTQKTPAALEAVSPLLERVAATRARLQGDMPVSEPCSLASTIIKAGGAQALPRAAAAALVRLLGCEGVVEQLPADAVWQAVRYGLAEGQRHGADLPDTVAQALQEKLVEYGETGMSPLRVGCQLHRCGASPDIVRRAAASMLLHADGPGRLCGYSPEEWRDVLDCLVECSICERLDVCGSDPRVGEGEVVEGEGSLAAPAAASPAGALRSTSMPLAALAMEAFRGLAAAAARDGSMQLVLEEDAQAAVSVLETASILERRLEGLQARRSELLDCLHAVLDSVVVGSMDQVVSKPLPKDSPVWSLAEAAFALGGAAPSLSPEGIYSAAQASAAAASSYWQLLTSLYGKEDQHRGSSPHGPFLVSTVQACRLGIKLANNAAAWQTSAMAAQDPEYAKTLPRTIHEYAKSLSSHMSFDAGLLTPRQLALAAGLLLECDRRQGEVAVDTSTALLVKDRAYMVSPLWSKGMKILKEEQQRRVRELRSSSSKAPTARPGDPDCSIRALEAFLDAVEPLVLCAPRNHTGYAYLHQSLLRANMYINMGVKTVITCRELPLPEGVTHMHDLALLNSPHKLDEASLLDDLRRPPGARRHPLVLPTNLRTADGGPPSPEQESYVRSIAPAFVALRRLLVLAAVDGGVMLKAQELEVRWLDAARGGWAPAPGRWAVLMGLVVRPEATCEWLARKEVARVKAGSKEAREALAKAKAVELLARVPWAGHAWEWLQEPLSKEVLQQEVQEYRKERAKRREQERGGAAPGEKDARKLPWQF